MLVILQYAGILCTLCVRFSNFVWLVAFGVDSAENGALNVCVCHLCVGGFQLSRCTVVPRSHVHDFLFLTQTKRRKRKLHISTTQRNIALL